MTQRKPPAIGISADFTAGNAAFNNEPASFLAQRYYRAVERAGAIPMILPPLASAAAIRQTIDLLDGLIISGGGFDIHPSYYGERPIRQLGAIKAQRTEFELDITAAALKKDLPVLGICGGAQALNVVLGGSLYQDLKAQVANVGEHQHNGLKGDNSHRVHITVGTRLHAIVRLASLVVNTTHHQAVKHLGKSLIVDAIADDGIIEGIESTRHTFVIGVQWHPEVLAPRRQPHRRIFDALIAACR